MTEQLIILSKEECHQSLPDFYNTISDKLNLPVDDSIRFDCRHICVTEDVYAEIHSQMIEEGLDECDRRSLWLSYGPKANIHVISDEPFFAAKIENGFIIFPKRRLIMEEEKMFEDLGTIVNTERVHKKMKEDKSFRDFVYISMGKYVHFDWGNTCEEDAAQNNAAVESGEGGILAVYKRPSGEEIWIKTEYDRSVTTILFPDEY